MILLGNGIRCIVGGNANDNTFALKWDAGSGSQKIGVSFADEAFAFPNVPALNVDFRSTPAIERDGALSGPEAKQEAEYPVKRLASGNGLGLREIGLVALLATLDFVRNKTAAQAADETSTKDLADQAADAAQATDVAPWLDMAPPAFAAEELLYEPTPAVADHAGYARGSLLPLLASSEELQYLAHDALAMATTSFAPLSTTAAPVVDAALPVIASPVEYKFSAQAAVALAPAVPVFDLPNVVFGTDQADILVGAVGQNVLIGGDAPDLLVAERSDLVADLAIVDQIRAIQSRLANADKLFVVEKQAPVGAHDAASLDAGANGSQEAQRTFEGAGALKIEVLANNAATESVVDAADALLAHILGLPQDIIILRHEVEQAYIFPVSFDTNPAVDLSPSSGRGNSGSDGSSGPSGPGSGRIDDVLCGGDGDDILDGGSGNDLLIGGLGNDAFIFRRGFGNDVITDFSNSHGNRDFIYLERGMFADYDDLEMHILQVDDHVVIAASDHDQITLYYFDKINLSVHDTFVFA